MDLEYIKQLMEAMKDNGLTKLTIKEDGVELKLENNSKDIADDIPIDLLSRLTHLAPAQPVAPVAAPVAIAEQLPDDGAVGGDSTSPDLCYITAPVVGTFYQSPSPADPSFVSVGDTVSEDSVVAIVEAMKVMNEVRADVVGTIVEQLVDNGHPVEFGTRLFSVEKV